MALRGQAYLKLPWENGAVYRFKVEGLKFVPSGAARKILEFLTGSSNCTQKPACIT